MSKIKLWENTHFDKIIAVYNDGTEEEIGYINDNGDKVYYGSSPSATAPKKFYSDWNQRQYDAYKQRQEAQLAQNGRSPDFGTLLYQHNRRVLTGASDLMRQAQARQKANDRKIIESKVYKQVQRQNPALLAASVFGSAGYGMSDNHPNDGKYKIKELKTKVENKINNLEKELENLKGEDKIEMKFRIKELKTAIKELEILLKSSSSFDIKTSSTPLLDYNPETNTIIVEYDGHEGSLLNELKHAYQFENKKIDFIKTENGIIPGYLYDIYDEVETYKRQYAYDGILELRLSWTEAEANKFLELNKIDMFSKFEITGEPENSVGILKIKSSKLINPDIIFKVKDGVDDKTVLYTTLSKKSLDANSSMKKISKLNHKRVDLKNIPRLNIEEFKNKKISYKEFIQIINNLSPFIYVK